MMLVVKRKPNTIIVVPYIFYKIIKHLSQLIE